MSKKYYFWHRFLKKRINQVPVILDTNYIMGNDNLIFKFYYTGLSILCVIRFKYIEALS